MTKEMHEKISPFARKLGLLWKVMGWGGGDNVKSSVRTPVEYCSIDKRIRTARTGSL